MEAILRNKQKLYIPTLILIMGYIAYTLFGPKAKPHDFGQIERPILKSAADLATKQIKIKFALKRELPKKASVYKLERPALPEIEAAKLASSFGFTDSPVARNPLSWQSDKKILSIDLNNSQIIFKDNSVNGEEGNLGEEALITAAEKFLTEKGLRDKDLIVDKKPGYLKLNQVNVSYVRNFEQADLIEVVFNRKLGEMYVFGDSPVSSAAAVALNKQGKIYRLIYNGVIIEAEATYPIKNPQQAAEKIGTSGILVETGLESGLLSVESLREILIEDYFLGYLDEDSGKYIQPIYIFRGRGFAGTYEDDILIYAPALEEKWLK